MKWILLLLISLTSCVITFNSNEYALLSPEEKETLKPFSASSEKDSYMKDKFIYEISKQDLNHICGLDGKILLNFWNPSCSGPFNDFVHEYIRLAQKNNLKLFLISVKYDLKSIEKINNEYPLNAKIYVLNHDDFGESQKDILTACENHLKTIFDYDFNDHTGEILIEDSKIIAGNNEVRGFMKY